MVSGIGVFLAEVLFVRALVAHRFASERGLVDIECHRLKQFAVGRHLFAGVEHYDVAHHHVLAGHGSGVAVSDNLHRLVVVHLVEDGKFRVGLLFKVEREACGKEYGHEYAYRFEEDGSTVLEYKIFVARYAHRKQAGYEKNDDKRVTEFLQELLPQRCLGRRCQHVLAMQSAALQDFSIGQSFEIMFLFHK